ncbi:MAG: bifunctional folylpolyglutamate synthase/dihydrofolate synthase [Thermodesulfobacteriota bacterium]
MTYEQCLKEMYGLRRFGIKLGLDVIENLLHGLGNPQETFSCIHVAGTNGKGSISSALAAILTDAGYKTGLYTSPHLVRFNERICINGREISDKEVIDAYNAVKSVHHGDREPTFFEYTTAMALYAFAKAGAAWGVIETGMGGRLDATNILSPEVTIISNISKEHSAYLGNTLGEIAYEKGGIIKNNVPVITAARQKAAVNVLRRIAVERKAPFYRLGEDFHIRRNKKNRFSQTFSYYGIDHQYKNLQTALAGAHQADNAALVIAASEILMGDKADISEKNVRTGLANVKWPGRLEILPTTPTVVIDGAHNLDAAKRLSVFLADFAGTRPITMVIGILDDKPYGAMLRTLLPQAERVIFTQPEIDRRLPAATLFELSQTIFPEKPFAAEMVDNVKDAVAIALETTPPENIVCIAGSLYVAGEARHALADMGLIPGG